MTYKSSLCPKQIADEIFIKIYKPMTLLQLILIISGLILIIIAADFFIKKKLNLFNIFIMCIGGILLPIFVAFPKLLDRL